MTTRPASSWVIRAGQAGLFEVRKGEHLTIRDLEGKQVADFIAFNASDLREYLSVTHTRSMLQRLKLRVGDRLTTNFRNPIFTVVADDVGVHDLLFAACDPRRYSLDYGREGHPNCRENFAELLRPYGVEYWRIPDPLNIFQNSPLRPDGSFGSAEPLSKPGDRFVLRAEMDALALVSACPMDLNPCNGWKPTDLEVTVGGAF